MLSPVMGSLLWSGLLILFLRYDGTQSVTTSRSLWLPVIWIVMGGSRLPSQWLGLTQTSFTEAFEEGSGVDRAVYLILIAIAGSVLAWRHISWSSILERNLALTAFIGFALASVILSDWPFITFKRWFRDLGMYVMIVLALSDPKPLEAVAVVIRRVSY